MPLRAPRGAALAAEHGSGSASGPTAIALARLLHTAFFLLTSAYCLLTYNAFAYRQFIKPHLVVWLTDFVIWHHVLYWVQFVVTAATLRADAEAGPARWPVRAYLGAALAVGLVLLVEPILPQVENDWRGLLLALLALVPMAWLAIADHLAARGRCRLTAGSGSRVFRACLFAGVVVWAVGTFAAPWRLDRARDIQLTTTGVVFGMGTSALAHAIAAVALGGLAAGTLAAARRLRPGGAAEYWALAILSSAAVAATCVRFVLGALSFVGPEAWLVAGALSVTLTCVWSGVARRVLAFRQAAAPAAPAVTAMDAWLAAWPGLRSPVQSAVALALVGVAAVAAVAAVEPIDWDFLFQRICVVFFWVGAVACAYGALSSTAHFLPWRTLAVAPVIAAAMIGGTSLAGQGQSSARTAPPFVPAFVLEGYAAIDPSFQLMYDLARYDSAEDVAFNGFLRAHSSVEYAQVDPISIDFVERFRPSPEPPPHVFVFIVDSLRRDYLSAYNPDVTFTPNLDRLAAESYVFREAFTRYGGTGLSVPAIWAGGMLLHKQYITPFGTMNALMKLLDAHGYRRLMSDDHIVTQLLMPHEATTLLDEQTHEMEHRLCGTFGEIRQALDRDPSDRRPVFAMTRPLQLHIARVRSKPVKPGASYAGFVAPVAGQVEDMDACIGGLIDDLRARGMYDNTVIVLMSDHGDSLGEYRRWGHSYTMFPEVSRIPLIVRVPPRLRERFVADTDRVALSTDVTPTLYALFGYEPIDRGLLYGRPLVRPLGTPAPAADRGPQFLASSYGPVYAVVRDNGRTLFIADGVNNRDYAFDLSARTPVRVGVTAAVRAENRAFIRTHLGELAAAYDFHPAP
ncbi:MAG: sulfatase-like hydrolase/transferase [Vicinamibacterales bacterium]